MNQYNAYIDIDIATYQADFEQNADRDYAQIDVREVEEFVQGRLPGALHIPLSDLQLRSDEIPQDKALVLVCEKGGRSMMAAEFLLSMGYEELYNLSEGTMGWRRRGLTLETD